MHNSIREKFESFIRQEIRDRRPDIKQKEADELVGIVMQFCKTENEILAFLRGYL